MQGQNQAIGMARGLVGAAIGGAVGYFAFRWVLGYGLYAMILPGAAVGFGFSLLTQERSLLSGIVCAVLAVGLGLFTEWHLLPFNEDGSFGFFIMHVHRLTPITLLMIAGGGLLAYWSANGRTGGGAAER